MLSSYTPNATFNVLFEAEEVDEVEGKKKGRMLLCLEFYLLDGLVDFLNLCGTHFFVIIIVILICTGNSM